MDNLNAMAQWGPEYRVPAMQMIAIYSDLIAAEYAWAIIDMYIYMVNNGLHNVESACQTVDPQLRKQIRKVETDRETEMRRVSESLAMRMQAVEFMKVVTKSMFKNKKSTIANALTFKS